MSQFLLPITIEIIVIQRLQERAVELLLKATYINVICEITSFIHYNIYSIYILYYIWQQIFKYIYIYNIQSPVVSVSVFHHLSQLTLERFFTEILLVLLSIDIEPEIGKYLTSSVSLVSRCRV